MRDWDISFLNEAWALGQKKQIPIKDVPEVLQKDLLAFLFGKTVQQNENGISVGHADYQAWLNKLNRKGFDYDIQLKPKERSM